MERRKFVIGLGSLAAGGAAATGTGALTAQSASRNLTVSQADDSEAYLALTQLNAPNSQAFADDSGTELVIDVSDNGNGTGINADGHTRLDNLFGVVNKGTQELYAYFTFIGNGSKTNAYLYDSENPQKAISPNYGNPGPYADQGESDDVGPDPSNIEHSARKLGVGEQLSVGLDIEEQSGTAFAQTETIQAYGTISASQVQNFPPNTHD